MAAKVGLLDTWYDRAGGGGGNRGEGVGLASTLLSSLEGGSPRVRKLGREATPGKPRVRINEDQAYKGLGDIVPPHSRTGSTTPSACSALRAFNGCCNKFRFQLKKGL